MSSLTIVCPKCSKELRLRDRSLLGRKAKCSQCAHVFVLEEPPVVELESAEVAAAPAAAHETASTVVNISIAPAARPGVRKTLEHLSVSSDVGGPAPDLALRNDDDVGSVRGLKRKNQRRSRSGWIFLLITLAVGGGGAWYLAPKLSSLASPTTNSGANTGTTPDVAVVDDASVGDMGGDDAGVDAASVASPWRLNMLPSGARIFIQVRPAELWREGSIGEELRFCTGPLGTFLESRLKDLCILKPAELDRVLFALIPTQRGVEPDIAFVATLAQEIKPSAMIERIGGGPREANGKTVYVKSGRAYFFPDRTTLASCSDAVADEMTGSMEIANPTVVALQDLAVRLDESAPFAMLFEPTAVRLDAEVLVPPGARPLLERFLDWLGDGVEAAACAIAPSEEAFELELLAQGQPALRPVRLSERLNAKLDSLGSELTELTRLMRPAERGKQQLIGRLPAMWKSVSAATVTELGSTHLTMRAVLPERAGPNLALASLLSWDESTRTNFSAAAPTVAAAQAEKLPERAADRLKRKIDVDFRRTPLQETFAYIADETKATIEIDGDGLKFAGFTKNEPQTYQLENVTGLEALAAFFAQPKYKPLCIYLDEKQNKFVVTTRVKAEEAGFKPFELPAVKTKAP